MGLNKLTGSEQSFHLHSRFGRSLVSFVSMSGNFNSAMEPLLALDRWIRYTQSELQSLRADTIQQKEEEKSIHRIQQMQLDSIQNQVRDLSQQTAELTEAITELFNHVKDIRGSLANILHDFNRHFDSLPGNTLPPTQFIPSQGTSQLG